MSTDVQQSKDNQQANELDKDIDVQEHQVPWFLWLFFLLIISWAGIAWIPVFGY